MVNPRILKGRIPCITFTCTGGGRVNNCDNYLFYQSCRTGFHWGFVDRERGDFPKLAIFQSIQGGGLAITLVKGELEQKGGLPIIKGGLGTLGDAMICVRFTDRFW